MWRLVLPLIVATVCGWILLYGLPPKYKGKVSNEIKVWLEIVSAVAVAFLLVSIVTQFFP